MAATGWGASPVSSAQSRRTRFRLSLQAVGTGHSRANMASRALPSLVSARMVRSHSSIAAFSRIRVSLGNRPWRPQQRLTGRFRSSQAERIGSRSFHSRPRTAQRPRSISPPRRRRSSSSSSTTACMARSATSSTCTFPWATGSWRCQLPPGGRCCRAALMRIGASVFIRSIFRAMRPLAAAMMWAVDR